MLQNSLVVGSPAEGSSLELNVVNILLLWLLQLNTSMKAVGSLCQRTAETRCALQNNMEQAQMLS